MSIDILVVALLIVTMSGKAKIEVQSTTNLTITYTSPGLEMDYTNMTTIYDIGPKITTVSYDETVFDSLTNHVVMAKKLTKNKERLENAIWPVKHAAEMTGDLILGGLMMVHEREDSVTCGPIMPQGGIQALETMLYTLDVINKMELLPNITVGAHILDDCDKDTYGLEMAVDFIKDVHTFLALEKLAGEPYGELDHVWCKNGAIGVIPEAGGTVDKRTGIVRWSLAPPIVPFDYLFLIEPSESATKMIYDLQQKTFFGVLQPLLHEVLECKHDF